MGDADDDTTEKPDKVELLVEGLAAVALAAWGPATLAYSCYSWLRYGYWPPLIVGSLYDWADRYPPTFEWVGVGRIFNSLLNIPLWLPLIFIAPVAWLFGVDKLGRFLAALQSGDDRA